MAITCLWSEIVGTVKRNDIQYTMYGGGNVYACICYDYEEDGEKYHQLADFICDKDHLKNILADPDNHYHEYTDFTLNGSIKETWQIAKLLVKEGISVTIVPKL